MIEREQKKLDAGKERTRHGAIYAPRSQRIVGGTISTSNGPTRVELDGKNNILAIYSDDKLTISIEEGQVAFLTPEGGLIAILYSIGDAFNANFVIDTQGISTQINGNFAPSFNNSYSLGLSSNRWSNVFSQNEPNWVSDVRQKKEIEGIKYGLETINKLKPISYVGKGDEERKVGFIAQEVKEVIPEVINGSEEEGYSMTIGGIVAALVKAVQELSAEVKKLKKNQ
jgi:hypothetical protein